MGINCCYYKVMPVQRCGSSTEENNLKNKTFLERYDLPSLLYSTEDGPIHSTTLILSPGDKKLKQKYDKLTVARLASNACSM